MLKAETFEWLSILEESIVIQQNKKIILYESCVNYLV